MKNQTSKVLSAVLAITFGLTVMSTVNLQTTNTNNNVVSHVTNQIDRAYCVSFSETSHNVEKSINDCLDEAKAERQTKAFL